MAQANHLTWPFDVVKRWDKHEMDEVAADITWLTAGQPTFFLWNDIHAIIRWLKKFSFIIILWDHHVICSLLFTQTSCSGWLFMLREFQRKTFNIGCTLAWKVNGHLSKSLESSLIPPVMVIYATLTHFCIFQLLILLKQTCRHLLYH
jgi:hypothetical protein